MLQGFRTRLVYPEIVKDLCGSKEIGPLWFQYPGKVAQMFTCHRGRTHKSKSKNAIYCCYCSCGKQYVGESTRNLKVHLSEHLQPSSNSSFSMHLRKTRHSPVFKNTANFGIRSEYPKKEVAGEYMHRQQRSQSLQHRLLLRNSGNLASL